MPDLRREGYRAMHAGCPPRKKGEDNRVLSANCTRTRDIMSTADMPDGAAPRSGLRSSSSSGTTPTKTTPSRRSCKPSTSPGGPSSCTHRGVGAEGRRQGGGKLKMN
eukprot:3938127-Rhodomonas_salina.4